jgi:hypothetical protein
MKVPQVNVPRLVVQSDTPGRRRLVLGVLVAAVLLLVWVAFQWGRGNLGLPGGITPDRVNLLEDEVRTLRVELARRESERVGQARERTELARTIGSLRADVQRLEIELGFYRDVVGGDGTAGALKVQQFRVSPLPEAGTYRMRVVLGRPLNQQGNVAGKVRVEFEGMRDSKPDKLDLAQVADVEGGELSFDFRYLQEIEQVIRLPVGFTPSTIKVELVPSRRGMTPVQDSFPWTLEN